MLDWCVSLFERLHLAPDVVARDAAVLIGKVERCLKDGKGSVCRRPAGPRGVDILEIDRRRSWSGGRPRSCPVPSECARLTNADRPSPPSIRGVRARFWPDRTLSKISCIAMR